MEGALNYVKILEANDNMLRYELADIKIWGNLGLYFSEKVRGGVVLSLFEKTGEEAQKARSVEHLENALTYWKTLAEISEPLYKEMPLVHLNQCDDKYFHWAKLMDEVKNDILNAKEK